ncbi:hypothetical protein B484DRAFT_430599 [Ochromonadaceae sp. CCMP2298]|nr:hypothetical protein B484DRAFT_430599 [Ochromonadaceae sp. CCMP2298]
MGRTGTIYVPNTEVNATVQYNAILRDNRFLVSLSKSKKNKSILILENLNIPVEFVHAPDATDDGDNGGDNNYADNAHPYEDYSDENNAQDDDAAPVYHVKGGVVKQKIFAALTDAIKEQYQLTDTWTSHKMLHVTAAVVDIAKDKANSAQQMNIAKEFEDNASFQCGKTHNFVIVPVTLKGSTSSSLGGSMFNAPSIIQKGVETFVGQQALQMLNGKLLHSCFDKLQLVGTQTEKKRGLLTLAKTAANGLLKDPYFKDAPNIQIVIDTIKNMIPEIPVSQFPSGIRLKRSSEGNSSSSSSGGNDDGNGIGNGSAPGSPPAVSFFSVNSSPTAERIPCPFSCAAQNFLAANFCKLCKASLFCAPCKEDGKRIRFDDGAEACIECGADVPPPRVGSVRARSAMEGDENQDGNAQRPRLDLGEL